MNICTHIEKIKKCLEYLRAHENIGEHMLMIKALTYLIDNIEEVDKYIPYDCHFASHLLNMFKKSKVELEDCHLLQENLILIFRAKLIKVGKKNMSKIELELLRDFEDKLKEEDYNSSIALWYYLKLPILIHKEKFETEYVGKGWKKWWRYQLKNV